MTKRQLIPVTRDLPTVVAIDREAAIVTILDYARSSSSDDDRCFPEMVGIAPTRSDITDEQWFAAISAMVPLLDDQRLTSLMFHIAESATRHTDEAETRWAEIGQELRRTAPDVHRAVLEAARSLVESGDIASFKARVESAIGGAA